MTTKFIHVAAKSVALTACFLVATVAFAQQSPSANYTEAGLLASKPPGKYCNKTRTTATVFRAGAPLVTTGYSYTPYHRAAGTGSDKDYYRHPAPAPAYAKSDNPAGWHFANLKQMQAAGLNMVLPVYSGDAADDRLPKSSRHFVVEGLPQIVKADESLRRQSGKALPIGMFYDTATLTDNAAGQRVDLSTPAGRAWFYVGIRNFYSCIPANLRATVDGKPFVFICPTNYDVTNGVGDARVLSYVRTRFRADFGVEPYLVAHDVWQFPNADAVMHGNSRDPLYTGQAIAFSPGWRQHPWDGPLNPETDRARGENGSRYRRFWELLLARPAPRRPHMVLLDSWNEWGNDTAIAPSREFGDIYIRYTRHYADRFTGRTKPKRLEADSGVSQVSLLFDPEQSAHGLKLITTVKDGLVRFGKGAEGGFVETTPPAPAKELHLYFAVDDGFRASVGSGTPIEIMLEYWDEGNGALWLHYDALDSDAPFYGAYKGAIPVPGTFVPGPPGKFARTDTRTWKSVLFRLDDVSLLHGQNGGADFRLVTDIDTPVRLRWVTVRRAPVVAP